MLYPSPTRREPQNSDTATLLVSCHARIRHFGEVAVSIAEATDVPESEIAEAARQLHRYFTHAFPLHEEDEDKTLLPRLRGLSADLDTHLERMHTEHERIHELVDIQVEAWQVLAKQPNQLATFAPRLRPAARELEALLETHLEDEEQHIFVALRSLGRRELGEIEQEIRERRRHTYHG